ncbi:MAG: hypothetical protein JNK57_08120 [Planctomycetaceae bacterium]|jgi:hypothetical protein|nr:hypothetical protein [Planctomycetaceae bacterium]
MKVRDSTACSVAANVADLETPPGLKTWMQRYSANWAREKSTVDDRLAKVVYPQRQYSV